MLEKGKHAATDEKRKALKDKLIKGGQVAVNAGKKIAAAELPSSLNWWYGFGSKVGLFLALKSFLAIRFLNLSATGFIMVAAQLGLASIFIVLGICMQNRRFADEPAVLRKLGSWYGLCFLLCTIVCILKDTLSWQFFSDVKAQNWFLDIFNNITKGAGEITLSIVFWDMDLWTAFCGLLYLLTVAYCSLETAEQDITVWTPAHAFSRLTGYLKALPPAKDENNASD